MNRTVIIIHEIYGITETLISLKDKLVRRGFSVIIPSLYDDNYSGRDEIESYNRFFTNAGIEKGVSIIDRVISGISNSEIILVGFSIGATIAWMHSKDSRICKIIGIYGSRIRDYTEITPAVESHLFFCEEKVFDIYPIISELEKKKFVKIKVINGDHGFYNSLNPDCSFLIRELDEEIFRIIES